MTTDQLRDEANLARKAAVTLGGSIYNYAGGGISLEELLATVDKILSPTLTTKFRHQFLLKDYDPELSEDTCAEDDTETLRLKDE